MPTYVAYDTGTGKIDHIREVPADWISFQVKPEGHEFLETQPEVNTSKHYVAKGKVIERPVFGLPDTLTIAAGKDKKFTLPAGTTVAFDGESFVLEDGSLVIGADMPASYELTVSLWPYVPHTMQVTVNAA